LTFVRYGCPAGMVAVAQLSSEQEEDELLCLESGFL